MGQGDYRTLLLRFTYVMHVIRSALPAQGVARPGSMPKTEFVVPVLGARCQHWGCPLSLINLFKLPTFAQAAITAAGISTDAMSAGG